MLGCWEGVAVILKVTQKFTCDVCTMHPYTTNVRYCRYSWTFSEGKGRRKLINKSGVEKEGNEVV